MGNPESKDPDEDFLRTYTWPEEDRHLFTTAPWDGGFRWFRSENVIPIERYRARKQVIGTSAPDDAA
jgi:hypothetical protein